MKPEKDRVEQWLDRALEKTDPGPFPKAAFLELLRWLLFLPAAVAAYFVVQLLNAVLSLGLPDFLVALWNSFVGPMAFMCAGIMVAPKGRFWVALLLCLLHTAFAAWCFYIWTIGRTSESLAVIIVSALIGVPLTIYICVTAWKGQQAAEI